MDLINHFLFLSSGLIRCRLGDECDWQRGVLLVCHCSCCSLYITQECVGRRAIVCVRICCRACVFACLVGEGIVGQKTYPHPTASVTLQPHSLQLYIFFTPHATTPTPITQTYTRAPTAPVAPPRLLREEQGDPGSVRGEEGGCNQGRTCPGAAFWSSSRQGDISALTPTLEEAAPGSGGGDGPPSFALR